MRIIPWLLMFATLGVISRSAVAQDAAEDDSLDAELLEGLKEALPPEAVIDGEDLGAPEDPLARMAGKMRSVEEELRATRLGPPTQRMQEEIIADLDKLIEQQQQKCQGGTPKPGGQPSPKPGSTPSPAPTPSAPAAQAGNQGASDSETATRPGEGTGAEMVAPQDLLKHVWGHLPQRLRTQMLQNPNEKFLPMYEREIEEYFRRLIDLEETPAPGETPRR